MHIILCIVNVSVRASVSWGKRASERDPMPVTTKRREGERERYDHIQIAMGFSTRVHLVVNAKKPVSGS